MGTQGVVLIDKHEDVTSRRIVDRVMRILKVKKAGHFGTLDPFATGLLCVGIGQGTKLLPFMNDHVKEYIATIGFDMTTDTDDHTGEVLKRYDGVQVDVEQVKAWLDEHLGWSEQIPPGYCAQKLDGQPLYKLKRKGIDVQPRPKQVHIASAEIMESGADWAMVRIVCSRGTYIRSIARDLGEHLGCGGYLRELRRLRSEGFDVRDALTLDEFARAVEEGRDVVIPLEKAVNLPTVQVNPAGEMAVRDGRPVQFSWLMEDPEVEDDKLVAILGESEQLLCVARVQRQGGLFATIERGFRPY